LLIIWKRLLAIATTHSIRFCGNSAMRSSCSSRIWGHMRWSKGELNIEIGYLIKFQGEFLRSEVVKVFMKSEKDSGRYFSKYTGFSLRRGLTQKLEHLEK
jgi:hypothetical protein